MCIQDETAQSQSVTLVLAYMLKSAREKGKSLTLQQAFKFVSTKRMNLQPNDGYARTHNVAVVAVVVVDVAHAFRRTVCRFMKQLINLEKDLYGEASLRVRSSGRGRRGRGRKPGGGGGKRNQGPRPERE